MWPKLVWVKTVMKILQKLILIRLLFYKIISHLSIQLNLVVNLTV